MSNKPKILVTNDDGIHAPGLRHLCTALAEYADLFIVAPASEKSGAGLSITFYKPLQTFPVEWEGAQAAWMVTGTPVDCVRLALSALMPSPPDLIVSGINCGANSGCTVLYSGTVGGAIEGVLRNIPGIAFSCVDFDNPNYAITHPFIRAIVDHILHRPLPKGTVLNVNFPGTPEIQGIKMAKQGKGYWKESPDQRLHPEGHHYYWLGGQWHDLEEDEMSDVHLLKQGFATAVPIQIQELTHLTHFHEHKTAFDNAFNATAPSS